MLDYFTSWSFIGDLLFWGILLNLLIKPLEVAIKERDRLFDPLGIIVMVLYVLLCFWLDSIMYEDDGTDIMSWRWYVLGFAFVWWSLLRFTDEDYDIEKSIDRAFPSGQKCPRCKVEITEAARANCPQCSTNQG